MRRRRFLAGLAGAMGVPRAARAQRPAPVVGFLNPRSPEQAESVAAACRDGLREVGYVDGQNVTIEYRWAHDDYARLPALAADLVERQVGVIVAGSTPSARAARTATATIPIVFTTGLDPLDLVGLGLVASVSRPGGNVTGTTFYSSALAAKELEMLRECVPALAVVAMLANSGNPVVQVQTRGALAAARAMGLRLEIVNVGDDATLDAAFASLGGLGAGAVMLAVDPVFDSRPERIAALAARARVPAIYYVREFVAAGGLMSYGGSLTGAYRQAGAYAGRILAGAQPADLPIQQPTTFQLVINLRAARAIGVAIPPTLLARADEVIE